jgi:hypothetical protein
MIIVGVGPRKLDAVSVTDFAGGAFSGESVVEPSALCLLGNCYGFGFRLSEEKNRTRGCS